MMQFWTKQPEKFKMSTRHQTLGTNILGRVELENCLQSAGMKRNSRFPAYLQALLKKIAFEEGVC